MERLRLRPPPTGRPRSQRGAMMTSGSSGATSVADEPDVKMHAVATPLDVLDNGSDGCATGIVRQPTEPRLKLRDERPFLAGGR